jgi:hypothetical protein
MESGSAGGDADCLAAAVYRSRLTDVLTARHAPGLIVHLATSSVAAADAVGQQAGGAQGSELIAAAHSAFVNAMAMGVRVAAGVALVSAVAAIFALPRRREPEATQAVPVTEMVTRPATKALLPAA